MRTYEAVFIFRPEAEALAEGREFVKNLFASSGCTIVKEEEVGNRELAYEVKKNRRGHYHVYQIEADPQALMGLDKAIKLRSEILKYLVIRKEE